MASNHDVAKAFIQGRKLAARNMYSTGDEVYSYGSHFLISKRKKWGYIFNKEGYSMTTAKHKAHVQTAINGNPVIELIDCDEEEAQNTADKNIVEVRRLFKKLERVRTRKEYIEGQIKYLMEQNKLIKEHYKISTPSPKELTIQKIKATILAHAI